MSFGRPEWLLLGLPLLFYWWFFLRRDRRTRLGRVILLALGLLAIADLRYRGIEKASRVTLLVDRSKSMHGRGVAKAAEVAALLGRSSSMAEVEIVGFGQSAAVVSPAGAAPNLGGLASQDESDLASGLELVAALAPGDRPHATLLISDGEYTGRDPLLAVSALNAKHLPVYILPVVEQKPESDTAIVLLEAPSRTVRGQPFPMTVVVDSPVEQRAKVRLTEGTRVLAESVVGLEVGTNPLQLQWTAPTTGLHQYRVEIDVSSDPMPENNRADLAVSVLGPPAVLIYNADGVETALATAFRRAGYEVTVLSEGPVSSAALSAYEAVILENISLNRLGDGADVALSQYVKELGGGLLLTGGRMSFAAGGYYRSAIEDLLPVLLDRPGEQQRPRVALAITMDRSGSMSAPVSGGVTKMDLADKSAAEAVRLLQANDQIAVFAVDSESHRVVPLSVRGEEAQQRSIAKRILSIESEGGGIFVYEALSAAVQELEASTAPTRHVLLYADAADSEEPKNSADLVAEWRRAGGTLSVVALGTESDSDAQLLKDLARAGGGRAFFTNDPRSLPRVFAQEVMQLTRRTFVEQTTAVQVGIRWPAVRMPTHDLPAVGGYNLTYLATGADELLRSGDENRAPLAALWQRGLGKVAAMTFEADGKFTGAMARWPGYQALFAHVLESIKRPASTPEIGTELTVDGRWATLSVDLDPVFAAHMAQRPTALVFPPEGAEPFEVPLEWNGAFQLGASFRMTRAGPYYAAVRYGGVAPAVTPPRSLPYSPEFAPGQGGNRGQRTLEAIAAATGGKRITHVDEVRRALRAHAPLGKSLAPLLACLMLAMVAFDVAQRRGLLDGPAQRAQVFALGLLEGAVGSWRRAASRRRERRHNEKQRTPVAETVSEAEGQPEPGKAPQGVPPSSTASGTVSEEKTAASESAFAIAKKRAKKRRI